MMSFSKFLYCGITFCILLVMTNCSKENDIDPNAVQGDLNAIPYTNLSEYNLFKGEMANLEGNEGVLPYDLITPLFTDYAIKNRFIWMPDGETAKYMEDDKVVDFPVGTIIIKNFKYENVLPNNTTRIIETRLLVRKSSKWEAYTYEWNEAQTEARFLQIGRKVPISWNQNGTEFSTNYKIPTQEECKTCHRFQGDISPIGPKPQNLSKSFAYATGSMNQLVKWQTEGYLDNIPNNINTIADWEDTSKPLQDRARAYLDINCAHCHNEFGSATNTSLYYNIAIENVDLLGFCKTPISAGGDATGGNKYDIVPGKSNESILVYRLSSTVDEIAMPELGRSINHSKGIQLISDWIDSLPSDDRCH
ncbi:MAG: SO2930 family diheme c-type cytochrome [Chitinophagales bacterium]